MRQAAISTAVAAKDKENIKFILDVSKFVSKLIKILDLFKFYLNYGTGKPRKKHPGL